MRLHQQKCSSSNLNAGFYSRAVANMPNIWSVQFNGADCIVPALYQTLPCFYLHHKLLQHKKNCYKFVWTRRRHKMNVRPLEKGLKSRFCMQWVPCYKMFVNFFYNSKSWISWRLISIYSNITHKLNVF